MNVYDFDGTIYEGDSTLDFWLYCLSHYPMCIITVPRAVLLGVAFLFRICKREKFKEGFYQFLRYVPNTEGAVAAFWDRHMQRIADWYLKRRQVSDLVISASPEFLISDVCTRLGISCIASKVDPATGKLMGPNCRGKEKIKRFMEMYPHGEIDEFFSDSQSDACLAAESKKAYYVRGNILQDWELHGIREKKCSKGNNAS